MKSLTSILFTRLKRSGVGRVILLSGIVQVNVMGHEDAVLSSNVKGRCYRDMAREMGSDRDRDTDADADNDRDRDRFRHNDRDRDRHKRRDRDNDKYLTRS